MVIISIRGLDSIYISIFYFYLIISMLYRLGLWLGLGKLRYQTGGPGGLSPGLGLDYNQA